MQAEKKKTVRLAQIAKYQSNNASPEKIFDKYPWTHVLSLTSQYATVTECYLEKTFLRFVEKLCSAELARIPYVYVIEKSPNLGRKHVHALVNVKYATPERMQRLWVNAGGGIINDIKYFDPSFGTRYTVKNYFISNHSSSDLTKFTNTQDEEQESSKDRE